MVQIAMFGRTDIKNRSHGCRGSLNSMIYIFRAQHEFSIKLNKLSLINKIVIGELNENCKLGI